MVTPAHEGFASTAVEPTTWDALRDFFHYQVSPVDNPQGIPIIRDPGQVDSAIETPGYDSKYQSLFKFLQNTTDPNISEDEKCRALGHPRELTGSRNSRPINGEQVRNGQGCGWWFVANSDTPSVAAFGSATGGVYDATKVPAGGEWIWDIPTAVKKEDIKRCKRVTTCSLISGTDRCGYCASKGHSVPVNDTGAVRYPQEEEGSCQDGGVITNTKDCPDRKIIPRYYLGDFNYDMNGNPIIDEQYRLIKESQKEITEEDPCVLKNGRITKECRLRMALELAGCAEGKGLHRIIQEEGALSETDRLAKYYLEKRGGITLPGSLWEPMVSGAPVAATATATATATTKPISMTDAKDLMERLVSVAMSGPPSQQRSAARWFIDETPFNMCDFDDSYMGPDLPLQCVQREFRKAGCQAAGTAYPTSELNLKAFTGMSYGAIKTQFRDLYAKMNDLGRFKNVREQDETIRQCLGMTIQRGADETVELNPNVCRERGFEYWFYTIPTTGFILLRSRKVMPSESPALLTAGSDILTNGLRSATAYSARTFVELSGAPVTVTLQAPVGHTGYSLWVNGQNIAAQTGQPNKFETRLTSYMRSQVEVRYEGGATNVGNPLLTFNPPVPLYLAQSAWKPVVSLMARKDTFADDNQFLQMDSPLPAAVVADTVENRTRYMLPLAGISAKTLPSRGLWAPTMGTITCMFKWSSFTGQATVWRLDQGKGGTTDTVMSLGVVDNVPVFTITSGTSTARVTGTERLPTGWVHMAVVIGTIGSSLLYMNARNVTGKSPLSNGTIRWDSTPFSRLVLGGPGMVGGIAWFHVYDTSLSQGQIQRDVLYDDPRLSEKEDSALQRATA